MNDRKELDFAPGFYICPTGQVYDQEGNLRPLYRNGDGYLGASIKTVDGHWVTFGIQRLVALAHVKCDRQDRNQVNHLDCNVENNHASNLEWVTVRENNIHATVMSERNRKPKVRYNRVGEDNWEWSYNAHIASQLTGVNPVDIWLCIKNGESVNGWEFNFVGEVSNVGYRKGRGFSLNESGKPIPKAVKLKDLQTGELRVFASIGEAGRAFKVSPSHIYQSIPKDEHPRFFLKRYQVAYIDEAFQEVTSSDIEKTQSHGSKEVIAYNLSNDTFTTFKSAKEFYITNNLSKKAVTVTLAKGILRTLGNWIPVYNTTENVKALKDYLEGPA